MILGMGTDLIDIRRIERSLDRFGARFVERVFTEREQARAAARANGAATYAKRFAAKEACAKALGTGVPAAGVHWRHMGVVNRPGGRPTMALSGGAADRLAALTPAGRRARIDVSITDEYPQAQVVVLISAEPAPDETAA